MNASRFRRCRVLVIEADEQVGFHLQDLLQGGSGVRHVRRLVALAGHVDGPVALDADEAAFLLDCSAEQWQPLPLEVAAQQRVHRLIACGLLVSDAPHHALHAEADGALRAAHWWPLAALFHRHSRWSGVDSAGAMERHQLVTAQDLVRQLGPPPPEAPPRQPRAVPLPRTDDALDALLMQRTTCRNFDAGRPLPLDKLAALLSHALMARSQVQPEPGVRFLKKNVPSAGGLHPVEAYVLVQSVEGLASGLYHYHAVSHELAPVGSPSYEASGFAQRLLSGQHWFADAHVLVILVCRFERTFWKYREHAKAYRAVTLDAGHISQALCTVATALGLGAFVTAAVNDLDAEAALSLDPMQHGVLAVCGCGWRAARMTTSELDPEGRVWS